MKKERKKNSKSVHTPCIDFRIKYSNVWEWTEEFVAGWGKEEEEIGSEKR